MYQRSMTEIMRGLDSIETQFLLLNLPLTVATTELLTYLTVCALIFLTILNPMMCLKDVKGGDTSSGGRLEHRTHHRGQEQPSY